MNSLPNRKTPRLKDYDYSENGAYFVTFCTKDRHSILGGVSIGSGHGLLDGSKMILSDKGKVLERVLLRTNEVYSYISLDTFVIMPNHVHMLISINGGPSGGTAPTAILPRYVGTVKRLVNRDLGENIWQRSFYEHIVRNEKDYREIWEYIVYNPAHWTEDRYYPG